MKKIYLVLMGLLTVMTAWAGQYTFNSQTGALTLVSGEFNMDNKWGSEVSPTAVKSVTATSHVSFTGDCSELFYDFYNCTSMDLNSVNTSTATSMSMMFYNCGALTSLDLSNWDTSNVTDMSYMFDCCAGLTSLNISSWNTGNVTNMFCMLYYCSGLTSLDLSNWDTSNVADMYEMFCNCLGLKTLDLSGWNTCNVTTTNYMFYDCGALVTLNISGWNMGNNTDMEKMFYGCSNLVTIYANQDWYSEDVTQIWAMFEDCTSLVGGMGTTYANNHIYNEYARIDRGYDVPGYFTGVFTLTLPQNVTASPNPLCTFGGASYYIGCSTVTLTYNGEVPLDKMVVYSVNGTPIEGNSLQMPLDNATVTFEIKDKPYKYTFDSNTGTLTLVSGEFNKDNKWGSDVNPTDVKSVIATSQVSFTNDCSELFMDFSNCTSMDLNSVKTDDTQSSGGPAHNMNRMFKGCSKLTTLDLSGWNTSNFSETIGMFQDCSSLTSLNISNWNTVSVTNMSQMFQGCSSLTTLNISSWNTASVTNMSSMFTGCAQLSSLNLSSWDTGSVNNMCQMFQGCSSLTSLNLVGWRVNNSSMKMNSMFEFCSELTTIYASTSWNVGNVPANNTSNMFVGCTKLIGGMGTTFNSNYTDKTYARIDRGTEQPGYFTGVFTLTLPEDVAAEATPLFTLGNTSYFTTGTTVTLTYNGVVPEGKMVIYYVNGTPIEGNTFQMPLEDVTVTAIYSIEVTVGDITFNMIKVDGNDNISSFYIGECEVTEALWQAVMGENPSSFQGNLEDNLPVEKISWYDCQEFITKLNQMTKLVFRLPTEMEWIFAARGGNYTHSYTYSGSDTVDDVAWYSSNCSQKMTVGTKAPNELGIHDMSGNVYEITGEGLRVYGGGWHAAASSCQADHSWYADKSFTDDDTGFRLAMTNFNTTEAVTVGDITFNMIKVDGNDDISTFYIGECEVTEALWLAVMGGENPSSNCGNLADNLPVENISWNDCQVFITKLNAMTHQQFRLPTSVEWLFAANGGNGTHGYTYSGSNTLSDVAWWRGNCSEKKTVGTKVPNELGIHDMSGNVYEIIQEATGVYGGGWHASESSCEINYYWPADEDFTDNDTGFRLAITNFGSTLVPGDVNGDGSVTSADVTCIYNYLLNGDESFIDTCDVDGDGYITSSDITVIYNILLGGK